jgi:hypothetical protein
MILKCKIKIFLIYLMRQSLFKLVKLKLVNKKARPSIPD